MLSSYMWHAMMIATWETLEMVLVSLFFSVLAGLPLGILLLITRDRFFKQRIMVNQSLSFVVNVLRSVPFIILLVAMTPVTRLIVGTSIGTVAAMVPLALSAVPFYARIVESALMEVSDGLKEAAQAMGASSWQIIYKVLLPESYAALVRGATLTAIALIGYSAMAGAIGGGGLGDLAIRYGYQRFEISVMLWTVVILIAMVQCVEWLGKRLAGSASS
jgi:D-methionine transport system permease protein